ncbi:MAG: hypothetical protein IAI50_20145, partial [Candidatus Eremiobacteraeota bacterium]|nr:hypothetical protein [Candidatus Eremiobacteraeota bacterium]
INIRNVTINNYRNLAVPNAAVAVPNTNFANGNFKRLIPLHGSDLKTIAAVHGVVPVVPPQHNLSPRAGTVASAAPPISARFANFKAPTTSRPPSFDNERQTVAAAAQKQYPEHAAAIAHPESLPAESSERATATEHAAPTEHAAAPAEGASRPSESNGNAVERDSTAPAARTNENGPWSRFGDQGISAPAPRANATQETPATTSRDQSPDKQNEAHAATKPATTNGGAWSRFNGNGGTTGNAQSRANGYSSDAPRSTVSGSRPASTPATSTATHSSTGRTNYGDGTPSYRQSPAYRAPAPAYHAPTPAYRAPAPAYHAPAAPHAAAPAPAPHAAPASA